MGQARTFRHPYIGRKDVYVKDFSRETEEIVYVSQIKQGENRPKDRAEMLADAIIGMCEDRTPRKKNGMISFVFIYTSQIWRLISPNVHIERESVKGEGSRNEIEKMKINREEEIQERKKNNLL